MGSPFDAYHYYVVSSSNGYESEPTNEVWTFGAPAQLAHDAGIMPQTFELDGNHPNPFNPNTNIRYGLPEAARVRLVVVDMLGREVARPVDGWVEPGLHTVSIGGSAWASGVYLYHFDVVGESGEHFTATGRMTLLK